METSEVNWADVESVKRFLIVTGWKGQSLVKYHHRANYNIIHTEREAEFIKPALGDKVIWRS